MIADVLLGLATSALAMSLLGLALVVALVVGFVPLIGWLPVLAPYVKVARLAAFLLFGLLGFLLGTAGADQRAEIAQLKRDLSFAETQLENLKATAADKARLADDSAAAAREAQSKAESYEAWLKTRPIVGGCDLDRDDVKRLRDITPRRASKSGRAAFPRLRGFGKIAGDAGGDAGKR